VAYHTIKARHNFKSGNTRA